MKIHNGRNWTEMQEKCELKDNSFNYQMVFKYKGELAGLIKRIHMYIET